MKPYQMAMAAMTTKAKLSLSSTWSTNNLAYADVAGLRQCLQARRNVDAVAVDVLAIEDDVTDVYADPKLDAPLGWYTGIALGHAALDVDRAAYRLDDAWEL